MSKLIERMYQKYVSLGEIGDDDDLLQQITDSASAEVTWLIYQFKNPAFAAEREWRLLAFESQIIGTAEKGFRPSTLGVVPYYDRKPSQHGAKLPIKSITVGPSPYTNTVEVALKDFLAARGYPEKTQPSIIPIRS